MPADEARHEAETSHALPEAAVVRTGPRHAAPKKPLLTRLHVPAGKAVAIAAMPSAVLMGMGLTPQLASAKGMPKSPYKPGPCVSQPDKDAGEHDKTEAEKKKDEAEKEKLEAAKKKYEQEKKEKAEKAEKGTSGKGSDSESSSRTPGKSPSSSPSGGGDGADGSSSKPSPSPSDSGSGSDSDSGSDSGKSDDNPLDPLHLGDALHKVTHPGEDEDSGSEDSSSKDADKGADGKKDDSAASDDSSSSSASPSKSGDSGGKDVGKEVGKGAKDTVGKVGDGVKDTTDKLGKGAEDAGKSAGDAAKGLGKGGKDEKTGADGDKAAAGSSDADGKKAFPCVEEKKSAGKNEQTPATLPNDPWKLEASSLALHSLDYKGVVNIRTADGTTKQALKFTASSVDIGDLHQIVQGTDGHQYHVKAAKGSTSTIRHGQVTLYTEKLQGNLFGLIPITFDPEHPPPINVPEAYFTKVKITQAGQFGGTLTIPGLHQYVD